MATASSAALQQILNDVMSAYDKQEAGVKERQRYDEGVLKRDREDANRANYIDYMLAALERPGRYRAAGINGGAAESALLGADVAYQNNRAANNRTYADKLKESANKYADLLMSLFTQRTKDASSWAEKLAAARAAEAAAAARSARSYSRSSSSWYDPVYAELQSKLAPYDAEKGYNHDMEYPTVSYLYGKSDMYSRGFNAAEGGY